LAAELAFIEVRVFPWRPRPRVMKASTLRDVADPGLVLDDFDGFVMGMALWLAIIVAAPVIVVLLAALLFSIELPLLLALALLLILIRLVGIIPWTVGVVDQQTGTERQEKTRSLIHAIRQVRAVNDSRRVPVRWSWS
jgi:hypothetical protein